MIKILVLFILTNIARAEVFRMVQVDKTFMGDISDEVAAQAYDNPSIEEKHKTTLMKAKVGDTILFVNRDEVTHNVNGKINNQQVFDVKLQDPGVKNDRKIEITKKGEYVIQCAIHPKMKLTIKVD